MLEGPITQEPLVRRRRAPLSWIDVFLPSSSTDDVPALAAVYYDYQAKLHWRASPRDEVDVFFFGSDDDAQGRAKGSSDPDAATPSSTRTPTTTASWRAGRTASPAAPRSR